MLRKSLLLFLLLFSFSVAISEERKKEDEAKEPLEIEWFSLTKVKLERDGEDFVTMFSKEILDLKGKKVRAKGFIIPVQPPDQHKNFILSELPANQCFFCGGGGPTTMIEVFATKDIDYTFKMITLEGTFTVVDDDPYGLFYRLQDAKLIETQK